VKYNCPEELWPRLDAGLGCGGNIGEGWYDLVRRLDAKIATICPDYVIDQVKEKFGALRFYIGKLPDTVSEEEKEQIYNLIHISESESNSICDVCGEAGTPRLVGEWLLATRCEKHKDAMTYD
jgi:hypothetical protein